MDFIGRKEQLSVNENGFFTATLRASDLLLR